MKGDYDDMGMYRVEDCQPFLENRDSWDSIRRDPVWWNKDADQVRRHWDMYHGFASDYPFPPKYDCRAENVCNQYKCRDWDPNANEDCDVIYCDAECFDGATCTIKDQGKEENCMLGLKDPYQWMMSRQSEGWEMDDTRRRVRDMWDSWHAYEVNHCYKHTLEVPVVEFDPRGRGFIQYDMDTCNAFDFECRQYDGPTAAESRNVGDCSVDLKNKDAWNRMSGAKIWHSSWEMQLAWQHWENWHH